MNKVKGVSVFGGRVITKEVYDDTVIIGKQLAKEGYIVFCGGGQGVMEAISKGVKSENGLVFDILKGQDIDEANAYLTIPISTGIGIVRNAVLAYNCDVAIVISGQYGTFSEISNAFQLDKPVIGYETWDIEPIIKAESPNDVIIKLTKEYNNV